MKLLLEQKKVLRVVALDVNPDGHRRIRAFVLRRHGSAFYVYQGRARVQIETLDGLLEDTPANRRKLRRNIY